MAGAYVSLKNGMPTKAATPHAMLMATKTYFTPIFCAIKPPAIGDTIAPEIISLDLTIWRGA
jgi:hypothetical protein